MASPHPFVPGSPGASAAALSLGALAAAASAVEAAGAPRPLLAKAIAPAPRPGAPLPLRAAPLALRPTSLKPKQKRYRANPDQLRDLIALFNVNPSPSAAELTALSLRIAMPSQSVILWFKNRRARVPHKKAEKEAARRAAAAKAAAAVAAPVNTAAPPAAALPRCAPADGAAALAMADLALPGHAPPRHAPIPPALAALCDAAQRSTTVPAPPPPPPRLPQATTTDVGASVPIAAPTPRRPRVLPATPRVRAQLCYRRDDRVEVLDASAGVCRAWRPATVVARSKPTAPPRELQLGASVATAVALAAAARASSATPSTRKDDGADLSPRTVQSPAASPTPAAAKARYTVRYAVNGTVADVVASLLRPAPPGPAQGWRPDCGDAVEALVDGAWRVGLVKTFAPRKGFLVALEEAEPAWLRLEALRAYHTWRGAEEWVLKTKAPLALGRRSVALPPPPPVLPVRELRVSKRRVGDGTRRRSARSKRARVDAARRTVQAAP